MRSRESSKEGAELMLKYGVEYDHSFSHRKWGLSSDSLRFDVADDISQTIASAITSGQAMSGSQSIIRR